MILPDDVSVETAKDMPRDELVRRLQKVYEPGTAAYLASLLREESEPVEPII